MKITIDTLRDARACRDGKDMFVKHYPDGLPLTPKNIRRAVALGLDTCYFAGETFSEDAERKAHATAKEHRERIKTTIEEYDTLRAKAWNNDPEIRKANVLKLAAQEQTIRKALQEADTAAFIAGCEVMGWLE